MTSTFWQMGRLGSGVCFMLDAGVGWPEGSAEPGVLKAKASAAVASEIDLFFTALAPVCSTGLHYSFSPARESAPPPRLHPHP